MRQSEFMPAAQNTAAIATLNTAEGLELLQRQAKLFANSTLIPSAYRAGGIIKEGGREVQIDEKRAIANCAIALSMAQRMQIDPMAIFQHMFLIDGKPSFGAAFMIALFNKTGNFTPIDYTFVGESGKDSFGCFASCIRSSDGAEIKGPIVTIEMSKKEGWYGKSRSKWQTMPELMLRYRAAAFLIRTTSPEVCLGLLTAEEAIDIARDEPQRPQTQRAYTYQKFEPITQSRPAPLPQAQQAPQVSNAKIEPQVQPIQAERIETKKEEPKKEQAQPKKEQQAQSKKKEESVQKQEQKVEPQPKPQTQNLPLDDNDFFMENVF